MVKSNGKHWLTAGWKMGEKQKRQTNFKLTTNHTNFNKQNGNKFGQEIERKKSW